MLETVDDHLNFRLLAAGLSLWVSLIECLWATSNAKGRCGRVGVGARLS